MVEKIVRPVLLTWVLRHAKTYMFLFLFQSQGTARPSFLLSQLEALDQNQKGSEAAATIDRIQAASAILFVAGSDT
ncbi:hypothetical protein C0995_003808, partial [Termitomyces sp. Mi166